MGIFFIPQTHTAAAQNAAMHRGNKGQERYTQALQKEERKRKTQQTNGTVSERHEEEQTTPGMDGEVDTAAAADADFPSRKGDFQCGSVTEAGKS